ncbi:hypothetical protein SAMN02745164_00686 [Marinitoga hydrogenitolerans DSM 16785]|uniref:GAF domain-containing protein n=1 Tax=Marinitoga hydrogenitolerans (strain DSM 16785 / JCM 12826 / AT1271) TaxID=1122195 RepID=A0A1M4UIF3_MARH1|nr:GAF domain-containing protein [Marinitoga hydrogenitolerans]SHE56479.1 hypothetical protein SAMN02745164_00686 [Marinitoga hydrogenitolerans DSM 16785]
MGFFSNLTFKEFDEYINDIFNRIVDKLNVDSGSLIVMNDKEDIIFKIEKNLKINVENISIGNIDKMVLEKKEPIIINDEDLENFNISKKKKDIISSIIFPLYFKDKLIGIINLNREKEKFVEKDLKYLFKERKYLLPSIYNIILLEEMHKEKERFKNYVYVMELIVETYSKTENVIDFMNEITLKLEKKYDVKIKFVEHRLPKKKGLIKIRDKYFEIKYYYEYDEEIVEKIKQFFEKILLIKHAEELNKILDNYSDLAKETLLMNFVSWDLIQEINSALTSLNLITFFFEEQYPDAADEIKKLINRIKNAVSSYKSRFYNIESIELIDLKRLLKEIEKKLVFLDPDIKFNINTYIDAFIYGSKKILLNAVLNIIVSVLKYAKFNEYKIFNVDLCKKGMFYILEIKSTFLSINFVEFEKSINISKVMLNNYHINFNYSLKEEKEILFKLEIPAKDD